MQPFKRRYCVLYVVHLQAPSALASPNGKKAFEIGLSNAPTQAHVHRAAHARSRNLHGRQHMRGCTLPEEQAAPEETTMPSRSKATTADLASYLDNE
jgi:hypothetical protein